MLQRVILQAVVVSIALFAMEVFAVEVDAKASAGKPAAISAELDSDSEESLVNVAKANATAKAPLEILEFVLSNKVEGPEPQDNVESFSHENGSGMAYAFARLNVPTHAQVTFIWFKDGKEYNRFTTNVAAAKKWRTYSSTKLRSGNWKVQLVSNGQVLAERAFMVH